MVRRELACAKQQSKPNRLAQYLREDFDVTDKKIVALHCSK